VSDEALAKLQRDYMAALDAYHKALKDGSAVERQTAQAAYGKAYKANMDAKNSRR
jgi:hypothetical protein